MKDETKLLPCPFCGGKVRIYPQKISSIMHYYIAHTIPWVKPCSLNKPGVFRSNQKDHLILDWNTRKDTTNAKAE